MLAHNLHVERCLAWVVALVKQNLVDDLVRHTQRSLLESLAQISTEHSKRGVLAARLEDDIRKAVHL